LITIIYDVDFEVLDLVPYKSMLCYVTFHDASIWPQITFLLLQMHKLQQSHDKAALHTPWLGSR